MAYEELIILIPSHSLEDFPTELGEQESASLLNAFAVPWHPALLARAGVLPRWSRADSPPEGNVRRLLIVPTSAVGWLPCGWAERVAAETNSQVITGLSERRAMLEQALAPLAGTYQVDSDLADDFLALGTCYLLIELLTRKMRNFGSLDEVHLQREAVAAAEAALAGDETTARSHLRACFEVLTEARERFYPVECYLLDICLLLPQQAEVALLETLATLKPINLLATASDLSNLVQSQPEAFAAVREAWDRGSADVLSGEWNDAPTALLPLNSLIWQFQTGTAAIQRHFLKRPVVWGRRKFGLFPQLPQILKKFGYQAGLHVALDDGFYPDAEHTKQRWDGVDGSVVESFSRIPLAADSSLSYIRFPERMAESMDNDHVAAVAFARWPDSQSPWLDDLRRMHNYSPVLGRWITFSDFFQHTDNPGRVAAHKPHEYLTPYLFQMVARSEPDSVSRFQCRFVRRQQYDTGKFFAALRMALLGQVPQLPAAAALERTLEELPENAPAEARQSLAQSLGDFQRNAAQELALLVTAGGTKQPGYLLLNPLPHRRQVVVEFTPEQAPPVITGTSARLQWDGTQRLLLAELPGAGYAWFPAEMNSPAAASPLPEKAPAGSSRRAVSREPVLAESYLLRNELFEVHLNEQTGGIRQIKGFGRSPNRLSQQLSFRYSRERVFSGGTPEAPQQIRSHYAATHGLGSEVISAGPLVGEVRTWGEIIDQQHGQRLAGFAQRVRVLRGSPLIEVTIEIDPQHLPDAEPWHNYYAARFAWNNESCALSGSSFGGVFHLGEERCESPHYIEIADGDQRTTILPQGLPFHRKTGPRMLDSLLIVAHESARSFRFVIAIDQPFPQQAALESLVPPVCLPGETAPRLPSGWFLHLDSRQVQVLDISPLMAEPPAEGEAWERTASLPPPPQTPGFCLRLLETEGRSIRTKLRCFRTPIRARQRDFLGKTICELQLDGDAILVDLIGHEIADVEIHF